MKKTNLIKLVCIVLTYLCFTSCSNTEEGRSSNSAIAMEVDARSALSDLYAKVPSADVLGGKAKAILVFPSITKGGFVIGGQYGKGVLLRNGRVSGYYSTTSASYGLQAGIQKFGYALFFMNDSDLSYLNKSEGWEIGVGPSITVVDVGLAKSLTSTTVREGVYAFFFEQRGLMAGLGIQGTKISRIDPDK